ncbi:hypothetical protein F4604DRAFT_1938370 [Suillus subluteus]|nr:hypothetical protein F4604DRAFT_1938370 [Suillus subluteus]
MKLSLFLSVFASIVAFATAYPTQGTIEKRSLLLDVEKREELDVNLYAAAYEDSY